MVEPTAQLSFGHLSLALTFAPPVDVEKSLAAGQFCTNEIALLPEKAADGEASQAIFFPKQCVHTGGSYGNC